MANIMVSWIMSAAIRGMSTCGVRGTRNGKATPSTHTASTQTQKKDAPHSLESVRAIDMAGRVMTLVANRDSEDSRPRESVGDLSWG